MDERSRQRQFEDQFLRQLRTRAEGLLRRVIPADGLAVESLPDGADAVRATLTRLERFDRGLLEALPGTRTLQLRFTKRVFGPFTQTVARLRVQVLAPLAALVANETPDPVRRDDVLDALARYELLPRSERPTAVVFASPTGFTAEAKALVDRAEGPTMVLMGGRADGGWDIDMPQRLRATPWVQLFELESQDERLKRLLYHLEQQRSRLESRGLSINELADEAGLSPTQTEALVRQACRHDSRLLTVMHDGVMHVSRSPLGDEEGTMTLWSRIRKLLGFKPTVAEHVRSLTAQKVRLEQQRHELDQRVEALEADERKAIEQGAAAGSDAEKKQVAARLVRTRRELRRTRAQANVFTQQLDILGTHIHHLTLAEQGKRVSLPGAEELTQEAAQAEQIMGELSANADLAANIEVGATSPAMADEEAAILREFEQAAAASQAGESPPAEQAPAAPPEPSREAAPPRQAERDRPAPPEVG